MKAFVIGLLTVVSLSVFANENPRAAGDQCEKQDGTSGILVERQATRTLRCSNHRFTKTGTLVWEACPTSTVLICE